MSPWLSFLLTRTMLVQRKYLRKHLRHDRVRTQKSGGADLHTAPPPKPDPTRPHWPYEQRESAHTKSD